MFRVLILSLSVLITSFSLHSCASSSGHGNLVHASDKGSRLANFPSVAERRQMIANEKFGDYFIGRRYFVEKTTFWGYLRKTGQSWDSSKLVIFNEDSARSPDRLPESGPGLNHGFDQNQEYKIWGYYTGEKIYEPNSNMWLPEFKLRKHELISTNPGWLFSPDDRYNKKFITLRRR